MIRLCFSIFFLLSYGSSFRAIAQDYNYTHYTKKDGLSGETVYGVTQDKAGFLWFGTETGLSRFDGRRFEKFTTLDGLPSNEVFNTVEDTKGRLWIISFSNQLCYYKDGLIHNSINDSLPAVISLPGLTGGLLVDNDGNVVAWDNEDNVIVIDTDNNIVKQNKNAFQLYYRHMKPDGTFAILSLSKIPAELERETLKSLNLPSSAKQYVSLRTTAYDKLIFSRNVYPYKTFIWDMIKKSGICLQDSDLIYKDMLGENEGLAIHYKGGGACIYNHSLRKEMVRFLPDYIIKNVFRDREDNLWFSTLGNGVFKLSNTRTLNYTLDKGSFPIQFIISNDTNLFIGAYDSYWQIATRRCAANDKYAFPPYQKKKLKTDLNWFLKNTRYHLINITNPSFLVTPKTGLGYIKAAYSFNDTVFIAASGGAFLRRGKDNDVKYDTVYKGRTTTCFKQGAYYYVGTMEGLLIVDMNYNMVARAIPYHISNIAPEGDSVLWVATFDKGIFKLKNGNVVATVNQNNSNIGSDFCRCIYFDGDYLWAGTDQGLNKIKITGDRAQTEMAYTTENGLISNEVNAIYVKDSIVYIGTPQGLNLINKNIKCPSPLLNLQFTAISIADLTVPLDKIIILPRWNSGIKFDFSAISFSLGSITYQYRVFGLNERWQDISDPSLNFISLPSGKYKLQVRAVSPLGYRSAIIQKEFEVKKAVFEQWWFWILIVAFIIVIMLLVIYQKTNYIKKKEAEKSITNERMAELEQMALRAQINPHFIFNCLNSVQNYILKQDVKGVNNYLSEFASLIRKTLDNSPKLYISLAEEISYLDTYIILERLQLKNPFEYTIKVDGDIQPARLSFPNMVLQPFVENAIKHALRKLQMNGLLKISFSKVGEDYLLCCIEDNGPGITKANRAENKTHQPKGMMLTQKRIETLNLIEKELKPVTLTIEDLTLAGGTGTRITIYVPIQYL